MKMSPQKELEAAEEYAKEFEKKAKDMANGSAITYDPDILLRHLIIDWIKSLERNGKSPNYYKDCERRVKVIIEKIGGCKVNELNPAIIQKFYNEVLDEMKKTVHQITPKDNFKEMLKSYGFTYTKLKNECGIQSNTMSKAIKGKRVSKEWAMTLVAKTGVPSMNSLTRLY
jgi:hypothetical protein